VEIGAFGGLGIGIVKDGAGVTDSLIGRSASSTGRSGGGKGGGRSGGVGGFGGLGGARGAIDAGGSGGSAGSTAYCKLEIDFKDFCMVTVSDVSELGRQSTDKDLVWCSELLAELTLGEGIDPRCLDTN